MMNLISFTSGIKFLIDLRMNLLNLFSNHSLAKEFGTEITTTPFSMEFMPVCWNHVLNVAFVRFNSTSESTYCQSSFISIRFKFVSGLYHNQILVQTQ